MDENINSNLEPLLSVVVVSRNDDHGGNLIHRMQLFVTGLLEQARRYNLNAELVIVEWNPPSDRPRLAEALKWPRGPGLSTVRIIQVSSEIHRLFDHSDGLPVFQMIGKNVGIRRARGRFILATNIDILFSNELVEFFASGKLSNKHMYRVDRYDVPSDIPPGISIDEQLAYCRNNVLRINAKYETRILKNGHRVARTSKMRFPLIREFKDWIRLAKPLHTNACGDFTLMAREHWFSVRGYPEFEMYSWKIDGLLCYAAYYAGAKEVILKDPIRIYHVEHSPGSGWSPGAGQSLLYKRLAEANIPRLSSSQYIAWVRQMRRQRHPIMFNEDDNWGLSRESLDELLVVRADLGNECSLLQWDALA